MKLLARLEAVVSAVSLDQADPVSFIKTHLNVGYLWRPSGTSFELTPLMGAYYDTYRNGRGFLGTAFQDRITPRVGLRWKFRVDSQTFAQAEAALVPHRVDFSNGRATSLSFGLGHGQATLTLFYVSELHQSFNRGFASRTESGLSFGWVL